MDAFGAVLPILLIGVVFYLLIMRPARARQKQQAEMVNSITPGTRIMTTAGVFGTVTEVDDDEMSLQIAPGVEIRMVKAAIGRVIPDETEPTPSATPQPLTEGEQSGT